MSESLSVIGRYILGIVICRIWGYVICFLCDHLKLFGVFLSIVAVAIYGIAFCKHEFGEYYVRKEPLIRRILYIYLYVASPIMMVVGIFINNM